MVIRTQPKIDIHTHRRCEQKELKGGKKTHGEKFKYFVRSDANVFNVNYGRSSGPDTRY